ncbi:aldehyde dehydrogenase [Thermosipho melanesiensis]|uniref:Aldehyde dehydrogenase n=2 Tax=Thermosipho melanesiensis TaxID=46541 RepID=A6LP14_THEM4|nr:aldehyde dehydrogenase family protein [Thermosipho melanesiensis]ABR31665.1 aldehyde dehydrogenase [Thermosipho melanesiensis BI429]OOC35189.1 aldehyde dehydrogenase [Thermosipho melanesiensis]OOC35399.1 aldehyde dehydrogenase [Thermosipho melanesiensis]OOC36650.1 aldehyde dehydrogenase [Thermosipho melanesiensis]OOC39971.1 aldehyde dehydrogenase [Thermosipho melanesiensis]
MIKEMKMFFNSGQTFDVTFRINQLKTLKRNLVRYEDEIYKALYRDLGKSKQESFFTEYYLVIREINYFLKNVKKFSKVKKVKVGLEGFSGKGLLYPEPYGVVLVISPWNYPVNLSLVPLVGAIAAGNCVVLKPSEYSENVSKVLEKIISETFQNNYVRVINGGVEISKKLLEEDLDYIFFTGNPNVGKYVMKKAAEKLISVTLELGGKNPAIVDATYELEKTAKKIAWGKLLNAGQTCISPDYLLIEKKIKDEFIYLLKIYMDKFKKDMANIVNHRHIERLQGLLSSTSGEVIYGGGVNGLRFEPTIVDNVKIEDVLMCEEIFGPILPIISFENKEDVFEIISKNPYPLALYVFSNDKYFLTRIFKIQAGGISVNDTITHFVPEDFPFGGIKTSGIGRYHGKYSFETFTHYKPIYKKGIFEFQVRYPPYKRFKLFRKLLIK